MDYSIVKTGSGEASSVDQRDTRAFVALRPPLACSILLNNQLISTQVHALAVNSLLLEPTLETQLPESLAAPFTAEVRLASGQQYVLRIDRCHQQNAKIKDLHPKNLLLAEISDPSSLKLLSDLLTLQRKSQHIAICAHQDVEASDRYTGFSDLMFLPKALPELAWADLDTSSHFLGQRFALPVLITGMTGGLQQGAEINLRLARAAAHFGIPMGVGSQRIALENPDHAAIFTVKKHVADVFLIGNLGAAQLIGRSQAAAIDWCQQAVEQIEADALALHLNILQELVQVEGDRDFRGLLQRIEAICRALDVPVIIKEVGCGIDLATARRLVHCGVSALDVGGKGGTSWSLIEGERAASPLTQQIGQNFRDWGLPTACAAWDIRRHLPQVELVATGGVRDGITVAKAAALGCRMAGVGLPLLRAALQSEEAVFATLETMTRELKTTMLASGSPQLNNLSQALRARDAFWAHMRLLSSETPFSRPNIEASPPEPLPTIFANTLSPVMAAAELSRCGDLHD